MPSAASRSRSRRRELVRAVRRDQGDVGGISRAGRPPRRRRAVRCRSRRPSGRSPHSRRRSGNSGSGRAPAPRRAGSRPSAGGGWDAGGEQHGARASPARRPIPRAKPPSTRSSRVTRPVSIAAPYFCACAVIRASSSAPEIPSGKAGMIVGAGDQRGAARRPRRPPQRQVEAGEIDGRGQPGRAAADDQAIEIGFVHLASSAAPGAIVPPGRAPIPVLPMRGASMPMRTWIAALLLASLPAQALAQTPAPAPALARRPDRGARPDARSPISSATWPSSMCRAWSTASSPTGGSSMSGRMGSRTPADPAGRVTPDSLFRIASMSKAFTALAILKLRDEGRLRARRAGRGLCAGDAALALSDQRQPAHPRPRPAQPCRRLRHRRSLGRPPAGADRGRVHRACCRQGAALHPRARRRAFEYSNYGYALLGRIVTNVSGRPLSGLYPRRDHAPARHDLQRLRHLRLAAGPPRDRLALGE